MSDTATPNKTVVEVSSDTHSRLREGATSTKNSLKRFTDLLLSYALGKFEAGVIELREPTIEETEPKETQPVEAGS
jgi:hypothetical protein